MPLQLDTLVQATQTLSLLALQDVLFNGTVVTKGTTISITITPQFLLWNYGYANQKEAHYVLFMHKIAYLFPEQAFLDATYSPLGFKPGALADVGFDNWPMSLLQAPSGARSDAGIVQCKQLNPPHPELEVGDCA